MASVSIIRNVQSSPIIICRNNLTYFPTKHTYNKQCHSCTDDYLLLSRTTFVSQSSALFGNFRKPLRHLQMFLTLQWQERLTDHHYEPSWLIWSASPFSTGGSSDLQADSECSSAYINSLRVSVVCRSTRSSQFFDSIYCQPYLKYTF